VLGAQHPDTLHSLAQFGFDLMTAGSYVAAVRVLAEAATGLAESLGQARPRTLLAAKSLAWALGKAGRPAEALAQAQETQALYDATYDADHPGALLCLQTLAAALAANGSEQAIRTAHRAASGLEDRFGAEHPSTLSAVNNAAVYERRAGNVGVARTLLERVVEGLTERLGPAHPNTCSASANLANCLAQAGRPDAAEPLERQALIALTAALGANHPDTRAVANNLATTLRSLGRRREARGLGTAPSRARLDIELPPIAL
jgi:tetratricopeptide (TPR) repeat protein